MLPMKRGTAEQMVKDAGVGESDNDQSGANTNSEGKTGILSTVLGGIGKVLTSKTGLAALASAAVLAVIGNDEMRKNHWRWHWKCFRVCKGLALN